MRYSQYEDAGERRSGGKTGVSSARPRPSMIPRISAARGALLFTAKHPRHPQTSPVQSESWHPGTAAVVAQAGIHPCLGKDDVDLVLLGRREERRADTVIWRRPHHIHFLQVCVPRCWRVFLKEPIRCVRVQTWRSWWETLWRARPMTRRFYWSWCFQILGLKTENRNTYMEGRKEEEERIKQCDRSDDFIGGFLFFNFVWFFCFQGYVFFFGGARYRSNSSDLEVLKQIFIYQQ